MENRGEKRREWMKVKMADKRDEKGKGKGRGQ
jgi:hypothetical protein